jgi:hypothetical protein
MWHAQVRTIRRGHSALLAGTIGLALSAFLITPVWAGSSSDINAGKPCNGCVGNADDKTPPGQLLDGSDGNAGYECDSNKGIGRGNPAHTGCVPGDGGGDDGGVGDT